MATNTRELSISLEELDDHLRAILKLKLREFVHLSPWFHNIPSINISFYPQQSDVSFDTEESVDAVCPNRDRLVVRRRSGRQIVA